MSESCAVEIYENERLHRRKGWIPNNKEPFVMKETLVPCKPLDEITVPSSEWLWSTNWKIIKMPGTTDEDGWEYASKYIRFKVKNRTPKPEQSYSTKARRRLWTRIMRREIGVKATEITKVLPKIQAGLSSINATRKKIEEIMKYSPAASESDEMRLLVTTVYRNIQEILSIIDQAEKQIALPNTNNNNVISRPTNLQPQLPNPAVLKKLRNDVLREQAAIERAIDPTVPLLSSPSFASSSSSGNTPSQKISISNKKNSFSSSSNNNGNGNGNVSGSLAGSMTMTMTANSSGSYRGPSFNGGTSLQRGNSFRTPNNTSAKANGNGNEPSDMMMMGGGTIYESEDPSFDPSSSLSSSMTLRRKNNPGSAVKSGSAKAFDPSIFTSSNNNNNNNNHGNHNNQMITITSRLGGDDEVEDGMFVDRSKQDLLISQKLIPIDESTVMQEIIDDRSHEIEKIHTGIVQLNNMFKDLSKLVKEQEEEIGTICENIDTANAQTKLAFQQIVEANSLQQHGSCVMC